MADDGFLSRWSRRKQDARAGKPLEEPIQPPAEAPAQPAIGEPAGSVPQVPEVPPVAQVAQQGVAVETAAAGLMPPQQAQPPRPPVPTIEDVRALTFESDFKRFVAPDVPADVKNAAVKKLWADPRLNVRDMMDVYADDYSIPDPMPESMLRQLASAQFLKLFEEKDTVEGAARRDAPDDVAGENVAQWTEPPPAVPHADADLRLQQDDAPAGQEPGIGIERGAHAPHDPVPPGSGKLPESDQG
jgi:hypothetical protein